MQVMPMGLYVMPAARMEFAVMPPILRDFSVMQAVAINWQGTAFLSWIGRDSLSSHPR